MTESSCPELEVLFDELAAGIGPALEHARACERCSGVLEEHRQLEKDLFRLADPLPPPDFVHHVMAKVATAPAPARSELRVGGTILGGTLGLLTMTFVFGHGHVGALGLTLANTAVWVKELAIALPSAASAVWNTGALPLAVALLAVLVASMTGLRRLAGGPLTDAKVLS